jgi:hypothetical protein
MAAAISCSLCTASVSGLHPTCPLCGDSYCCDACYYNDLRFHQARCAPTSADFRALLRTASHGDAAAALELGLRYKGGIGTAENVQKAVHWLVEAHRGGAPLARGELSALNYECGFSAGQGGGGVGGGGAVHGGSATSGSVCDGCALFCEGLYDTDVNRSCGVCGWLVCDACIAADALRGCRVCRRPFCGLHIRRFGVCGACEKAEARPAFAVDGGGGGAGAAPRGGRPWGLAAPWGAGPPAPRPPRFGGLK